MPPPKYDCRTVSGSYAIVDSNQVKSPGGVTYHLFEKGKGNHRKWGRTKKKKISYGHDSGLLHAVPDLGVDGLELSVDIRCDLMRDPTSTASRFWAPTVKANYRINLGSRCKYWVWVHVDRFKGYHQEGTSHVFFTLQFHVVCQPPVRGMYEVFHHVAYNTRSNKLVRY